MDFFRFPRTPHLFWQGSEPPRGDKLLTADEADRFLQRPVTVEEKVDGACIGFSLDPAGRIRVQNRGSFLEPGGAPQFRPLRAWLAPREPALAEALGPSLILFGEWCYARHSVAYDALPDWFLAYDVYDAAAGRFWSRRRRDAFIHRLGLTSVPILAEGVFDRQSLRTLCGPSRLGSTPAEGVYLRWDDGDWLAARAKLVRPGWMQEDEGHWSSRPLEPNRLAANREGGVPPGASQ